MATNRKKKQATKAKKTARGGRVLKRGAYKDAEERRAKAIRVMASEQQWEQLKLAADAAGLSLSTWMLKVGLAAASKDD